MDPILKAVLLSWSWRLEVIIVLALAGTLYTRGWWRLRRRSRHVGETYRSSTFVRWRLTSSWRLASYWAGLFLVALALLSPIDSLGQQLFLMHMVQHLLLIMFAPPLLLLANPFPVILWGLPDSWRRVVGRGLGVVLHRQSVTRKLLRQATSAGIIWMIWVIAVIGWHDPGMYNWALRSEIVHDVEHLSFFLVSMLFWWHVIGAGPRIHKQAGYAGRVGLLIAAIPANMLTGMVLAFMTTVVYTYYEAVPRLWGIDALTDQRIGGIIMWVPGSMMFIVAALILIGQMVSGPQPVAPSRRLPQKKADPRPAPHLENAR
ncbi:MAG: cytochrome c oxidase assembly protein [Chloroflexi bacterium]|nr:cytochrome c oxidase assembly protein [Chloroflexota bacterium]